MVVSIHLSEEGAETLFHELKLRLLDLRSYRQSVPARRIHRPAGRPRTPDRAPPGWDARLAHLRGIVAQLEAQRLEEMVPSSNGQDT